MPTPRRFRAALIVSLVLGASTALAQTERTWTDPPVRGAAAPPAPARPEASPDSAPAAAPSGGAQRASGKAAKSRENSQSREASKSRETSGSRETSESREISRTREASRTRETSRSGEHSKPREVARSRETAQAAPRRAVKVARVRTEAPRSRPVVAEIRMRRPIPMRPVQSLSNGESVVVRYGYRDNDLPVGRVGGFVDDRAERIRRAQDAGYLVVRSRNIEFPDGRSLRAYRPYEDDGEDE